MEEENNYAFKDEEILTKKHEKIQRAIGRTFFRGIGKSYGESEKSNNTTLDKGKYE